MIRAALCLLLAFATAPLVAQNFSISGTVESATTGTPLDRAEVTLSTSGQQGTQLAEVVTTQSGVFRFDHLEAGRYRLEASRRGYLDAGYQEHDNFFTAIVVGPHLESQSLHLTLFPAGVISGVITDDSGEPVPSAQVHLYRQNQSTGETRVNSAGMDSTDDTGTYEFSRLRPGTYYIGVFATPWYALHPSRKTDSSGMPLPEDQQPQSTLDVAYSMTFYANATDSTSATPISLNPGDRTEVDVSLHAVPAIHIRVTVPVPEQGLGHGMIMPMLAQDVFGDQQPQPGTVIWTTGPDSKQPIGEFDGVAPGHYVLRQAGQQEDQNRTAAIDVSGDLSFDFSAQSVGGAEVSGKLTMASGQYIPERTGITLVSADGHSPGGVTRVAADGSFNLHSVAPGNYEIEVHAPGSNMAITQIAVSSGVSPGNEISVGSDPVLLVASLTSGSTTLAGYATHNGQGIGGVMILLVPRNPASAHQLIRRDQSNSDGSFTLSRVLPGNYILVAIQDGWTLDWSRREAIAQYLANGVSLQVTGQRTIALPSPIEVEPR